jgi:hypothetical protein
MIAIVSSMSSIPYLAKEQMKGLVNNGRELVKQKLSRYDCECETEVLLYRPCLSVP